MAQIGFIGLGIMGKPMSRNLLKAGHSLVVYDVVAAPVAEMVPSTPMQRCYTRGLGPEPRPAAHPRSSSGNTAAQVVT